jgi:hypothetical protein
MHNSSRTHAMSYLDHSFTPAAQGWRALYLIDTSSDTDADDPQQQLHGHFVGPTGGYIAEPIAGWLTQVQTYYSTVTLENDDARAPHDRDRRVVAATTDGADVVAIEASNLWCVLAPAHPNPTVESAVEELKRRAGRRSNVRTFSGA